MCVASGGSSAHTTLLPSFLLGSRSRGGGRSDGRTDVRVGSPGLHYCYYYIPIVDVKLIDQISGAEDEEDEEEDVCEPAAYHCSNSLQL